MMSNVSSVFVIGALGALGVATWSGCGPGDEARSYCDATGCFTCDAYGCSRTDTPAPPTCAGNAGCNPEEDCTATGCAAPQTICKYSSECGDDEVCVEGQCLASCAATACSDGFTCNKGVCKPSGDGSSPPACVDDAECGDGKYCNQGACAVDTRPKPNCTTDDQCGGTAATPKKCLAGFCKFTCTSDQHCRTIDNRIGHCAKDGVCRTSSEVNAACTEPGQCADGTICIDNQCR